MHFKKNTVQPYYSRSEVETGRSNASVRWRYSRTDFGCSDVDLYFYRFNLTNNVITFCKLLLLRLNVQWITPLSKLSCMSAILQVKQSVRRIKNGEKIKINFPSPPIKNIKISLFSLTIVAKITHFNATLIYTCIQYSHS